MSRAAKPAAADAAKTAVETASAPIVAPEATDAATRSIAVVAIDDRAGLTAALADLGGVAVFREDAPILQAFAAEFLPRTLWPDLRAELLRRFDLGELTIDDMPIELKIAPPDASPTEQAVEDAIASLAGKRWHLIVSALHDDKRYEPGDRKLVDYDEFVALKAACVFDGEWAWGLREDSDAN